MLLKQESTSQNLGFRQFWRIANRVLNKGEFAVPLLFNGPKCCLLNLIKQNYLLKIFLRTLILMTQVSLYLFFLSRTNLKLHISVTLKIVKKVITNLDSSKASGPDCIPVLVLENLSLNLLTY